MTRYLWLSVPVCCAAALWSACGPPPNSCQVSADCFPDEVCVKSVCVNKTPVDAGDVTSDAGGGDGSTGGGDGLIGGGNGTTGGGSVLTGGGSATGGGGSTSACQPGTTQNCCTGRGTQFCGVDGVWSSCNAAISVETCDAIDNDCNGYIDDSPLFSLADGGSALSVACSVGVGACTSTGHLSCQSDAGVACDAPTIAPAPETCDGLDNDCDGTIDNQATCSITGQSCIAGTCACPAGQVACGGICQTGGGACSNGKGVCARPGVMTCNANGVVACDAVPGSPSQEICDGLDNNCDGVEDEGLRLDCYVDFDNDGYRTPNSNTTSPQCRDNSRTAFGYCPSGYVAPTSSLGVDCQDDEPAKWQWLGVKRDADGDGFCSSAGAASQCIGSMAPTGYRLPTDCNATIDCNDNNSAARASCDLSIVVGTTGNYECNTFNSSPPFSVGASCPAGFTEYVNSSGASVTPPVWSAQGAATNCNGFAPRPGSVGTVSITCGFNPGTARCDVMARCKDLPTYP